MAKVRWAITPLEHTPETLAAHNRYLRLWAEYREKSSQMRKDKVPMPQIMALYEDTLRASGPPGDDRPCRFERAVN